MLVCPSLPYFPLQLQTSNNRTPIDWICNWFGGEAVSKQLNHTTKEQFNAAGYTPFLWNGTEYGSVREYGNFSFTRIYEAGHEVPFYQRALYPTPHSIICIALTTHVT
jgi:carboxypeptidase C (cathepsin A)